MSILIEDDRLYEGWQIRAAFLPPEGPAVRMEYSKRPKAGSSALIQDYEVQAIMSANTPPGTSWKQIAYDNPDSPTKDSFAKPSRRISGKRQVRRCGKS